MDDHHYHHHHHHYRLQGSSRQSVSFIGWNHTIALVLQVYLSYLRQSISRLFLQLPLPYCFTSVMPVIVVVVETSRLSLLVPPSSSLLDLKKTFHVRHHVISRGAQRYFP
jgi:hypothetical protein